MGCTGNPLVTAAPTTSTDTGAEATGPRLYILDCGTIRQSPPFDPAMFSLKQEEVNHELEFVTPCYLIVHPKGTLVWEVGQILDKDIPDDGTEVVQRQHLRATRRLETQLATLGHPVESITYMAMSHYHWDHAANSNAFVKSTWIVQQAEYDIMFREGEIELRAPENYQKLRKSRRVTLNNADFDVFGDGSVVIKTAPGHTPGHQMLFLRLAHFGPLLLSGDLYHLPEERTLDRVPVYDFDAASTRASRRKVELFLKDTGAQMWIQHDPTIHATLRKAPQYYN